MLGSMPAPYQPPANPGTTHPQGKGWLGGSSRVCPGAWRDAHTHRRFVTDDSDMDVRLGMEGSASLAAESTWPPWEVGKARLAARQQGPSWAVRVPIAWPEGTRRGHTRGRPPPRPDEASQLLSGPSHHPSPTTCPDLVNEADSITDVQLVVNIPDLIPQPVGRFPHQELAQILLVELFPPTTR